MKGVAIRRYAIGEVSCTQVQLSVWVFTICTFCSTGCTILVSTYTLHASVTHMVTTDGMCRLALWERGQILDVGTWYTVSISTRRFSPNNAFFSCTEQIIVTDVEMNLYSFRLAIHNQSWKP